MREIKYFYLFKKMLAFWDKKAVFGIKEFLSKVILPLQWYQKQL